MIMDIQTREGVEKANSFLPRQWACWAEPHLAGLLALHDPEDGVLEGVVHKGRGRGLHVLLHQRAGQGGGAEECGGLVLRERTQAGERTT